MTVSRNTDPTSDLVDDAVRQELVDKLGDELVELDAVRSDEVEAAVRAVPRHVFVSEVPLSQAYAAEDAPVVKRDEDGVIISSVSAVRIQAMMLERVRGLTRSVAFDGHDKHLVGRDYQLCGFVPMQGVGQDRVRLEVLHDREGEEVGLRLDDRHRSTATPCVRPCTVRGRPRGPR
ncbi:hypothetical protein [Polymorphospora rubra]|uniref:hypothetical protein n=1 Tax=Polymorphospora rubra TaxID=338584 RepID=UPI0033DB9784